MQLIGIHSLEELFSDIPQSVRLQRPLNVSEALDEHALLKHTRELAGKNADLNRFAMCCR